MNHWTELSVQYANQRNYLDALFKVYPTVPEGIREIDKPEWNAVEKAFNSKNNKDLVRNLLKMKLFPIKDSYVAYLKRDDSSIDRNPSTVDRLCGRLYEMGLDDIFINCSLPKETNRKIGPLFGRWVRSKALGVPVLDYDRFVNTKANAVLDATDGESKTFARHFLNYKRDKGLDFVARFNGEYVIGEAKFLTDFGGHQNAQFADALQTLTARNIKATVLAILDGVLYIPGQNKMFKYLKKNPQHNIMSALVLREFLYQL